MAKILIFIIDKLNNVVDFKIKSKLNNKLLKDS